MVFVSHIFPAVLNASLLQLPSIIPESCHLIVEILKAVEDQVQHYGDYSLQCEKALSVGPKLIGISSGTCC